MCGRVGREGSALQRAKARGAAGAQVSRGVRADRAVGPQGACVRDWAGRARRPWWEEAHEKLPGAGAAGSGCRCQHPGLAAKSVKVGRQLSLASRCACGVGSSVHSFIRSFIYSR